MTAKAATPRAALAVVYRPLDSLKPYAKNARTHAPAQLAKLEASLMEYGWTNPIAVAGNDIIAGHGRLMAAMALREKASAIPGLDDPNTAPVIDLSHLTAKQRRAYILADNRLALDAGWDEDMLAEELSALKDDGFDLQLTGFDTDEMDRLLASPGTAPDAGEAPPGDNYSEQYGVIVICKDATHQEQVYEALHGQGFNLKVVTT